MSGLTSPFSRLFNSNNIITMKNNYVFKLQDVPFNWAMCFNDNCDRKDGCMRHQAGSLAATTDPKKYVKAQCVTPIAYKDGTCQMYAPVNVERQAWGFDHLYDQVLKTHFAEMKEEIVKHLRGMSNYYRYRNGELKLSEAQQQWIEQLFSRYGYTEPIEFDHYEYLPVFPF